MLPNDLFGILASSVLCCCHLQDALLEAFLIMPAQLAHLLTFVPRIMPPLVSSLQVRLAPHVCPCVRGIKHCLLLLYQLRICQPPCAGLTVIPFATLQAQLVLVQL